MKQGGMAIIALLAVSSCTAPTNTSPASAIQPSSAHESILTAAAFNRIKDFVLIHGDRQTYCNMYNNNPHAALCNMDVYLVPDTGQQNINCDLKLSGFNSMVIRTRKPWKYYRLALNLRDTGPDLTIPEWTKLDDLRTVIQNALSELDKAKITQSNHAAQVTAPKVAEPGR
jgi:hypothetical protein